MADPSLIERFARAMFDEWQLYAVSQALAEQSGQPLGSPLTYDAVLEMGGNHNGLLRLAKGAAKLHASTLEDQARLIGECRSVMVAVMQERRGYFGLVDALLTKLNAFGERDE